MLRRKDRFAILCSCISMRLRKKSSITLHSLKKIRPQVGSFFDPMPSQLFGNIHRTNEPDETVIGYVGVYTTEHKTIISSWRFTSTSSYTGKVRAIRFSKYQKENLALNLSGKPPVYIPFKTYYQGNPPRPWVQALPRQCMDCRTNATVPPA
jgi:hypothetical protein